MLPPALDTAATPSWTGHWRWCRGVSPQPRWQMPIGPSTTTILTPPTGSCSPVALRARWRAPAAPAPAPPPAPVGWTSRSAIRIFSRSPPRRRSPIRCLSHVRLVVTACRSSRIPPIRRSAPSRPPPLLVCHRSLHCQPRRPPLRTHRTHPASLRCPPCRRLPPRLVPRSPLPPPHLVRRSPLPRPSPRPPHLVPPSPSPPPPPPPQLRCRVLP
mmetsp:Transcript_5222/g.13094  ORF Transcript_5222/g.13094 Transcript_5222/m.13094 type:complete len:214 (+) Transcript_5222:815-1456(+)